MSDYQFMRTGQIEKALTSDEILKIGSVFLVLVQNAIEIGGTYTIHAKRNIMTETDARMSLKLEVMVFCNRTDIFEKARRLVEEWKKDFNVEDFDNVMEDEEDTFRKSDCKCYLCTQMNNIDKTWDDWKPSCQIEEILKRNVEKIG